MRFGWSRKARISQSCWFYELFNCYLSLSEGTLHDQNLFIIKNHIILAVLVWHGVPNTKALFWTKRMAAVVATISWLKHASVAKSMRMWQVERNSKGVVFSWGRFFILPRPWKVGLLPWNMSFFSFGINVWFLVICELWRFPCGWRFYTLPSWEIWAMLMMWPGIPCLRPEFHEGVIQDGRKDRIEVKILEINRFCPLEFNIC